MAWRIDVQPNGRLAIFSEIVDDFTYYNMTFDEAIVACGWSNYGLGRGDAIGKIQRGIEAGLSRWDEDISLVRVIHGEERAKKVITDCSANLPNE